MSTKAALPPTLNDADVGPAPTPAPGSPNLYSLPYPRINLTEGSAGSNIEIPSKYNTASYAATQIGTAARLKQAYPQTVVLRYFVDRQYQSRKEGDGSGRSFLSTGPASVGTAVYAGHWLYLAGQQLKSSIDSNALVLSVNAPGRFKVGQYVVIYDGGAGGFLHAEHAQIASINTTAGTLTLVARGYKSTPVSHPAGSIVAQHEIGAAGAGVASPPEDWAYNMGTRCPLDANGMQMNVVMAEWLASNLNLDSTGNPVGTFTYDGVLTDGEIGYFLAGAAASNPNVDMDNNLVAEAGLNPTTGENMHGQGMEVFYSRLRSLLGPSKVLVASNGNMRGFSYLNGTQCEGYPTSTTTYASPPNYSVTDQKFASYSYHLHNRIYGPVYTEVLSKTPTLVYPFLEQGGTRPTSNAPFRYGFGMTLLDNGSYGQKRTETNDPWWDEYSVDVVAGSPTFGQAIPNDDTNTAQIANVRAHTGWLGAPLGPRTRIVDATTFDVSKNLLANPGFESGQGGWTGQNVTVSLGTGANAYLGANSLHSSSMTAYRTNPTAASLVSPVINLPSSTTYTLCFAVKSSKLREFGVQVGNGTTQTILSGTNWKSHTFTFSAAAGNNTIRFYLGRESSDMWFDEIYLFQGNADVFKRDFQNGSVFVNATTAARTISLNTTFRRIKGTQDPVNNGSLVGTQLTVPAHDAAILIRVQ